MKKTMTSILGMMLMVIFIGFSASSVNAANFESLITNNAVENDILATPGDQDFILVNKTGVEIYALYITPNSAKTWGEDVLGVDTLASGEYTTITFSPGTRATYWDLRIEDEDGNYIEWDKFNLKKISQITLYYENGKATAIYE